MGSLNPDVVDAIPGKATDRKTPLGDLNWIFTFTDSIAWNILPKPLFQRLFRQDLLVASLFRNFQSAVEVVSFPLPSQLGDEATGQEDVRD
jgi:regulatory associated protein of mTOR